LPLSLSSFAPHPPMWWCWFVALALLPSSLFLQAMLWLVLLPTVLAHTDYEPSAIKTDIGWGVTKCIDYQEVTTLYREITVEPTLVVTCELKTHQCVTVRAVNTSHYYTFQGCVPQARAPTMCTEMAYEAAKKNGAEYFFCYDVSYDRLNVAPNVPFFGRECCCNGDFCNRIENVKTIDTLIPHDAILSAYGRILHLWYYNLYHFIGLISGIATVFFWINIFYIILKPAKRDDDSAWYTAPITRNQLMDDVGGEDEEEDAPAQEEKEVPTPEVKGKGVDVSRKKKTNKKKKGTREEGGEATALPLQTEKTQDCSQEDQLPQAKTGDDGDDKKEEKKASKEGMEKGKKEDKEDKENKTQEEPKKEEEEKGGGAKQFKLGKPKKLANGRIQYISMFNENSEYDDSEGEKD
ncbi:hypothetical protein PFISCL1PPCAC_2848, partial [Pristionchus fissidentatus]